MSYTISKSVGNQSGSVDGKGVSLFFHCLGGDPWSFHCLCMLFNLCSRLQATSTPSTVQQLTKPMLHQVLHYSIILHNAMVSTRLSASNQRAAAWADVNKAYYYMHKIIYIIIHKEGLIA